MKKIKKIGLTVFTALVISSMGQVAFAGQQAQQAQQAQKAISYRTTLPATGSYPTDVVVKTNTDTHADNYVSYIGWAGSSLEYWMTHNGSKVSDVASFSGTGNTRTDYTVSGTSLNKQSIGAIIKTGGSTWHECDVRGEIYP